MTNKQLMGTFEAILFASGEPIAVDKIAQVLELKISDAEYIISLLEKKYIDKENGIQILRLGENVQFCSNPIYVTQVRDVLSLKKNSPLSQAAMEVISLVAYNEPVTKAFIEQVRGVDCSGVLSTLIQRELVEERGRLELPGRPLIYGVTDNFLRCFGLNSLSQLPTIPQEEPEEEVAQEQSEQLTIGDNLW